MIYRLLQTEKSAPLFDEWQETMIWSCLQGIMGTIYADAPEKPASAMALLGKCYSGLYCLRASPKRMDPWITESSRDKISTAPITN